MKLTASLHCIRTLNALVCIRDSLKLLKTLDVVLSRLTTSTRTCSRNSVCSHNKHVKNSIWLNVCMVGLNGVNNLWALTMTTSKICTNYSVWTLNLVVNCLTKVMKQTSALSWSRLKAKLFSHNAAKYCNLNRVSKNILTVRSTVAKLTKSLYDFWMKIVNATIKCSLFTSLKNTLVNKSLSLLVDLLNTCWMNTTVCNEVLKCNTSGLTADWIKT